MADVPRCMSNEFEMDFIEGSNNNFIAKCRLFISIEDMVKCFESIPRVTYQDRFYDKFDLDGYHDYVYRDGFDREFNCERYIQNDANNSNWKLTRRMNQQSRQYGPGCHYYKQSILEDCDWEFSSQDCFLTITFQRFFPIAPPTHEVRCYVDMLDLGFMKYRILNLDCKVTITENHAEDLCQAKEILFPCLQHFSTNYPVFSKFMFALRLSPNFKLYEDVFAPLCSSLHMNIDDIVDKICDVEDTQNPTIKEYIWNVSYVHDSYECCKLEGFSDEETIQYISDKWKKIFGNKDLRFATVNANF